MADSPKCPVCERPAEDREVNDTFPFCSGRCKRLDLARWFDESYTIPITPHATERTFPSDEEDSSPDG